MPFLRFARDKRGYETTSLVHAFRGRQGRTRQKVLYWFRTPPNVKVGRPALDQEAIRWIEEHNPDIEFDWPKILKATPAPGASEEERGRRQARSRSDRTERSERLERRPPQRAPAQFQPPWPENTPPGEAEEVAGESDPGFPGISADSPENHGQLSFGEPAPEEEALQQITHPDAEEAPKETISAVESVLGREQLIRFRARYAELQARIIERGSEAAGSEELRTQAEALNPDSWVTVEEARSGLDQFEPKIRELRGALGLRRRRRSRGGHRRRVAGEAPSSTSDGASHPPDTGAPGIESGEPDNAADGEEDGGDTI